MYKHTNKDVNIRTHARMHTHKININWWRH